MADKSRKSRLDLPLSLLLGIGVCGLLGYLIGLRIIVWNPDLIGSSSVGGSPLRNTVFLLLSTSYLYAILGALVGLLIWAVLRIYGRLAKRAYSGRALFGPWLTLFIAGSTLLFIFLMLTRQNIRTGHFDNVLIIAYYFSLLFLSSYLYRSVHVKPDSISPRSRLFTLPRFFLVFGTYLLCALIFALLNAARSPEKMVVGDKKEIETALTAADNGARVAIIGWDGAEWSVIHDLFSRGMLPNLKRLVDTGVSGPFKSLEELRSPLIWTSIATGKLPKKHGIKSFGTFQFAGMANNFVDYPDGLGLYRLITLLQRSADLPVTSSVRRCQAFWNILSDARRTVGTVGWWASWPAEKVNGFVLSDRFTYTLFNPRASALSLREGQTYPPQLLDQVSPFCRLPDSITDEEIGRFMPHAGKFAYPEDWNRSQYVDWNPLYQFKLAYTATQSFRAAGLQLYQEFKPEVFAIYFEGIDMVSHYFWQYYQPREFPSASQADAERFGRVIPEFYGLMDEILGDLLSTLEAGTDVIIVSDHGFGPDPHPVIPYRTGDHRLYGVFVASGPHFKPGIKIDDAAVIDITPTLLYLFGLPAARDMDGKILTSAIESSFLKAHPPAYIKSYETGVRASSITRSSADAQLKEQIKALGYTQ